MRVVVWNAHWNTLGGGEVYAGYLAGYLANLGNEVELVGLGENPMNALQKRLGLNLQGIRYTKIPSETYLLALLKREDLFVNGSFGSTFVSPVEKSIYICHFPQKSIKRQILAKFIRNDKNLVVSSEGSILHPIDNRVLLVGEGLAYFNANKQMSVHVEFGQIGVYKDFELIANLKSNEQYIFGSKGYYSIKSLSKVVPVTTISGASTFTWVKKFFVRRFTHQKNFTNSYSQIWANSKFTAGYITRYWKVNSRIVYPPHIQRNHTLAPRNQYDILSIGRFMHPRNGHCKNQLILVKAFEKLCSQSTIPWKLHLAGGVDPSNEHYFREVRDLVVSKNLNVYLYPNCIQSELDDLLQTSKFFWHATGMGVSKNKPEDMEHFGIAVVEALHAGLIPIVYDVAGPAEILSEHPLHRFSSIIDLVNKTKSLSDSNAMDILDDLNETKKSYNNMSFQKNVDFALSDLEFAINKK